MYSICIKFKPELNWRPYCRQFDDLNKALDDIDGAFKKWEVHHACIFRDGKFLQCYWLSPSLTASLVRAADYQREQRRKLYGNYINR